MDPIKNTDEWFRMQHSLLLSTIESYTSVLIFSIDTRYNYLVANAAFRKATRQAYGTEVEMGKSMLDSITVQADKIKAKNNCDLAMKGQQVITIQEYGEINKSYFETKYLPIHNENQEIIGVTVMSNNISERVSAEEKIKSLNSELEAAVVQLKQTNKELEAFSYSVSHDLRAPLRAINGFLQIINEDYLNQLQPEVIRLMNVVSHNAQRMGMLIDNLLDFSRLGRKEIVKMKINMAEMIAGVYEEQLRIGQYGVVNFKLNSIPDVDADIVTIKQVWENLISNALKYSHTKQERNIEVGAKPGNHFITFYIKDNGVGFDMQYANNIFGVFQRLHSDEEFEGTGVGLAIVQRIITKHGGNVWAESMPDKETTFYFTLPR